MDPRFGLPLHPRFPGGDDGEELSSNRNSTCIEGPASVYLVLLMSDADWGSDIMRRPLSRLVLCLLCLGIAWAAGADVNWPATNAGWIPVTINGGQPYTEPNDDTPDTIDIRGDATYNAGYWFFDGTDLMFRMRLDDTPGGNTQAVWVVLIDTDGDDFVEWSLAYDAKTDDQIELSVALVGGPLFSDVTLDANHFWFGTPSIYGRFVGPTGDGSTFDGDVDGFVDMAIPFSSLSLYTGVTLSTPLRVAFATSTSHQLINKDLPDQWGDPFVLPEPGTITLLALGLLGVGVKLRRRKPDA